MTTTRLILQSLRHHARAHLGVVLGATVGSAALIGALLVGDSVRGTLRAMALARLGDTTVALDSSDRFFRDALADDLNAEFPCAPLVQLSGTCTRGDGEARANQVQVIGVDERIRRVTPSAAVVTTNSDSVVLNTALAAHLRVKPGDTVLVRVQKPSLLSREAPITPQQDFAVALRLTVAGVAADEQCGRFSLRASQLPPYNAFVPLRLLQEKLELHQRANVLLGRGTPSSSAAHAKLKATWKLADAELELVPVTNAPAVELRSRRVFLDPPAAEAANFPALPRTEVLTYFVNELRAGTNSTPYSMVTAATAPLVPPDMANDEILINQWLAEDLGVGPLSPGERVGARATVELRYYVIGATKRLEERTNAFRVRAVVPLAAPYADRALMPEFPGIAKAEKTEDWDAGFPIQMSKIRPKDEAYWKEHRGTPKAFVTLAAGRQRWSNRFGDLTAVRFPGVTNTTLAAQILSRLAPESLGLRFEPVREQALAASSSGQDFGQLFLGFSFFLIVAALILMGLMFQFGLEQRITEIGTLLALGFKPRQVRRIFFLEGLALALVGGLVGTVAGIVYARVILRLLTTIWSQAVGTSSLAFYANSATYGVGVLASVIVAACTIWLVLRKQARQPAHELLARGAEQSFAVTARRPLRARWIAAACLIAAGAVLVFALRLDAAAAAGAFFGAGALLLIAGVALSSTLLARLSRSAAARALSVAAMGIRSTARRRKRSLATVALLAAGSFMIVAVAANRLEANLDAHKRSSGTGGFALIGETTLPVFHDLNTGDGRDFFGLTATDLEGVSFVPLRVREGDDASCLNLNRAQNPRILGVNPGQLSVRYTFTFTEIYPPLESAKGRGWDLLGDRLPDGSIPAIGDANSIRWALGKKVGDVVDYVDERGRAFQVRIVGAVANSILQGNLLIDESAFLERFPGEAGYRMFLIDAPSNRVSAVSATLSRALQDVGLELTPAAQRLAMFNAVQNTYLSTFQVLGGVGLLVGAAGLGVVVLRNVLERRGELGLLLALGYRRDLVRRMVLSEHAGLLGLGLLIGLVAALCAVAPVLFLGRGELPYASLAVTLAGVALTGMICTVLATWIALRGNLLNALRNE